MRKNKRCSRLYCKSQYIKFERLIDREAQKPAHERDSSLLREYIESAELYRNAYLSMRREKKAPQPRAVGKGAAFAAVAVALVLVVMTAGEVTGTFRAWSAITHFDAGYLSPNYHPSRSGRSGGIQGGMAIFSEYHADSIKAAEEAAGVGLPLPDDADEVLAVYSVDVYVVSDAKNTSDIHNVTAEIRGEKCTVSVFTYDSENELDYALSAIITADYRDVNINGTACRILESENTTSIVITSGLTVWKIAAESGEGARNAAAYIICD